MAFWTQRNHPITSCHILLIALLRSQSTTRYTMWLSELTKGWSLFPRICIYGNLPPIMLDIPTEPMLNLFWAQNNFRSSSDIHLVAQHKHISSQYRGLWGTRTGNYWKASLLNKGRDNTEGIISAMKPREGNSVSLLRYGHGCFRAGNPIPTPVTPNLLFPAEAKAYVRPHSDKLQDHYSRSCLDGQMRDSFLHNC